MLYINYIDWTSIKLNVFCFLGFMSGSYGIMILSGVGILSTIIYNSIRIYKELKNKK